MKKKSNRSFFQMYNNYHKDLLVPQDVEVLNELENIIGTKIEKNLALSYNYDDRDFSFIRVGTGYASYNFYVSHLALINLNLQIFPNCLCKLSHLEELSLFNNQIKSIPIEINQLVNLRILNLSNNLLSQFPKDFEQLNNLVNIYIENNKLEKIPKEFQSLTNLNLLYLNDNPICNLYDIDINWLKNILHLRLTNINLPKLAQDLINNNEWEKLKAYYHKSII